MSSRECDLFGEETMKDYVLLLLSVVLLALGFVIQKLYQKITDTSLMSASLFQTFTALFSFIYFFLLNGCAIEFSLFSFLNALLKSACGFAYSMLGYKIIAKGNLPLYMLFLMSGGMVVPAIYGWIFLSEPLTLLRVLGVIVIVIAVVLTNSDIKKISISMLIMCLCVFFLNGLVSTFSKLHQIGAELGAVDTNDYILLGIISSVTMSTASGMIFRRKGKKSDEQKNEREKKSFLSYGIPLVIILLYSVVGGISSYLQLEGAKNLPASVLYPIITGGGIILTGIFGRIFFGEQPSKRQWISILICFVGTFMFL